ncbi:zinc finger and SCAN domain-containing protein 26-like [Armigeres subalbatus]|uniref:zinc finger and SCAN domain-containing protein 26-like n=1 Tax=Armigeres subalbatus TaxID=124917 RepID=UPI002ED28138
MSVATKSVPSDNPNDYCRLCFSSRNLVALFQYDEELRQALLDEVLKLTGIKIEVSENQPCSICWRCAVAVEDFQTFRKKCLENDAIIQRNDLTTSVRHGQDEWVISIPVSEVPPEVNEEDNEDKELVEPLEPKGKRRASKRNYGKFSSKKMDELNTGESQTANSTTCHLCKHEFVSRPSLYAHFKEQHSERGRPHKCNVCQATFKRKSHLVDHVASHSGEAKYDCHDCGTTYSKAKSLIRHRRSCHHEPLASTKKVNRQTASTEGQFQCMYCPKSFKHRSSMNFHIKTHNELLPFVCVLCEARFANKKGMLVHRGKYHPSPLDAFKEVSPSSLEPKKNVQCKICSRSFEKNNYLTQHMKFMHPNECGDLIEQENDDLPEGEENASDEVEAAAVKVEVEDDHSAS